MLSQVEPIECKYQCHLVHALMAKLDCRCEALYSILFISHYYMIVLRTCDIVVHNKFYQSLPCRTNALLHDFLASFIPKLLTHTDPSSCFIDVCTCTS